MPDADDLSATLAEIKERAAHADRVLRFGGNFSEAAAGSQRDVPLLLTALEAVLKAADRLDSGHGDYGHLVNRHETAAAFREAITTALTGKEAGDDG